MKSEPSNLMGMSPWQLRATIIGGAATEVLRLSSLFIHSSYAQRDLLDAAESFSQDILFDTAQSTFDHIHRVDWFPWTEASRELSAALDVAMLGFHRASIDHQRRGLELVVIAAYLVGKNTAESVGPDWINSISKTPPFTRAIDKFAEESFPRCVGEIHDWSADIKSLYRSLCDIVHIRGRKQSLQAVQPARNFYNGIATPEFSEVALARTLDSFITVVQHCALVSSLSNPIILYGVPLTEKYGLNPPASGFLEESDSARLRELLQCRHREALLIAAGQDTQLQEVRSFFDNLPDLPEVEWENQVKDFNEKYGGLPDGET